MSLSRFLVPIALAVILGVPFLIRPRVVEEPRDAERLVIITPHGDQIRSEFAAAFDRWHHEHFGKSVVIDWRVPGGTTEIRRQLQAVYTRALSTGNIKPDGTLVGEPMPFDLLFGGGSYEHSQMKKGVTAVPPGGEKAVPLSISVPPGFEQARLDEWYGKNEVGAALLYDKEQYWLGNALSGFGIAFNRDALRHVGMEDPRGWDDLANPKLDGWIGLADPRASGSVATTFESILYARGWDEGWKLLRGMSANARSFANSSPKVPIDIGAGEVAAGLSIDYYGRYESQSMMKPGETPLTARVGYFDPPGETMIDPDPVSLMRCGPNPTVAKRFIEFLLTEEGQALWDFRARGDSSGTRDSESGLSAEPESRGTALGPARFELRRLPIRRVMYEKYADRLIDRVNPYEIATKTKSKNWRDAIGLLMAAFSIEIHDEQVAAWRALNRARTVNHPDLARLEELFYAMPTHEVTLMKDGGKAEVKVLPLNEENYATIAADWSAARKTGRIDSIRVGYLEFFRKNYKEIVASVRD